MTRNSPTPRRIVVGVDFSDNAARAAGWAAREAGERGLPLHVVHSIDLPAAMVEAFRPPGAGAVREESGERLLDRIADGLRRARPDVAVTTELSATTAAETLVGLSGDAELVVTGTRGHGGFAGLLLGSVSHALAAHARCPAVVVRGEDPGAARAEVVLGVEPGQDPAAIRFAFDAADRVGASVTAVRAWWARTAYEGPHAAAPSNPATVRQEADVAELIAPMREEYPQVTVCVAAIRGNPVPVLADAARGSRLLVVGSRRRLGPLSVGVGHVVAGVLAHCPAPVAVVPIP